MTFPNPKFLKEKLADFDLSLQTLIDLGLFPFGGFVRDVFHQDNPNDLDLYFIGPGISEKVFRQANSGIRVIPLPPPMFNISNPFVPGLATQHMGYSATGYDSAAKSKKITTSEVAYPIVQYFKERNWKILSIDKTYSPESEEEIQLFEDSFYSRGMKLVYRFIKETKQIDLVEYVPRNRYLLAKHYDFSCNTFIFDPQTEGLFFGVERNAKEVNSHPFIEHLKNKEINILNTFNVSRLKKLNHLFKNGWQLDLKSFWKHLNHPAYFEQMPVQLFKQTLIKDLTSEYPDLRYFAAKLIDHFSIELFRTYLYLKFKILNDKSIKIALNS